MGVASEEELVEMARQMVTNMSRCGDFSGMYVNIRLALTPVTSLLGWV